MGVQEMAGGRAGRESPYPPRVVDDGSAGAVLEYEVVPDRVGGFTILGAALTAIGGGSIGSNPAILRVFTRADPSYVVYERRLDDALSTPLVVSAMEADLAEMTLREFLFHYLPDEEAAAHLSVLSGLR